MGLRWGEVKEFLKKIKTVSSQPWAEIKLEYFHFTAGHTLLGEKIKSGPAVSQRGVIIRKGHFENKSDFQKLFFFVKVKGHVTRSSELLKMAE